MFHFMHILWVGLWAENSTAGKIIIVLIAALTFLAWREGIRHLRRYRSEVHDLQKVKNQLQVSRVAAAEAQHREEEHSEEEKSNVDVPSANDPNSERREKATKSADYWESLAQVDDTPRVEVTVLKEGVRPSSLIYERLEAIEKMRGHQVKVNLRTLQHLTEAREEAQPGLQSPASISGIAMMLGILGTFLGLATMVQEIQFHLPSDTEGVTLESWTGAFSNIGAVLGGIKTAFSTSLVGMTCATFLTLIRFRLEGARAQFTEQLERFTTEDLLPSTAPTAEDESLMERISLQLENSFVRLGRIFEQNQEMLRDLMGAQEAFVDIVEEVRLITKNEASRNLERVVDELVQTNQRVGQVVGQLPGVVDAMESRQSAFLARLSPWRQTMAGLAGLWNSRLLGCIPGSLVLLAMIFLFALGTLKLISDFV